MLVAVAPCDTDRRAHDEDDRARAADGVGQATLTAQLLAAQHDATEQLRAVRRRRGVIEAVEEATGSVDAHRTSTSRSADRPRLECVFTEPTEQPMMSA